MKNFVFGVLVLFFITSCSKYPDPASELIRGYSFFRTGSDQRAWAGEFLKDSILLQINGQRGLTAGMRVEFNVLTGGGELTRPFTIVNESGIAYTRWKTGSSSHKQIVKASIYDLNGDFLSSTNFMSYAFRPGTWDTIEEQPEATMWDLAADTVNNQTYMISSGQLFRQSERYYDWVAINTDNLGGLTSIEIDSRNHLYISSYNGDVYASADKGLRWNKCTRPFTGKNNYIELFVSNNNDVWVSSAGNKLLRSKDEGVTWEDASAGLSDGDGLGEIYQYPDGTFFFRTTNYRLFRSDDDGKSWSRVKTQERADELYITTKGVMLIYASSEKHRLLKSTDKGEHFTEIYATTSNRWTTKLNFFNYYKGTFYLLIPGKGIIRTNDLIHFEEYWINPDLWNLFISHDGVLMARGLNNRLYYKKNV